MEVKFKFDNHDLEQFALREVERQMPAPKGFHWEADTGYNYPPRVEVELTKDEEIETWEWRSPSARNTEKSAIEEADVAF